MCVQNVGKPQKYFPFFFTSNFLKKTSHIMTCICPSFDTLLRYHSHYTLITGRHTIQLSLHMFGNVMLCLETLPTKITLEHSSGKVSEDVFLETELQTELFPTIFTHDLLTLVRCCYG